MRFRGILTMQQISYQQQALLKEKVIVMIEEQSTFLGLSAFLGWVQTRQGFTNFWTDSQKFVMT